MTTNSLNNETKADFTVKGASGSARKVRVENDNNTASSIACSEAYVGGTSAGDAFVRHVVGSSHSYALGVDNSDSDKWKLTYSADATATPSSANVIMNADTSGRWRRPMTPLFRAYLSSTISSTNSESPLVFDTEEFDQGSNYNNTTGVFTFPVTGSYLIVAQLQHGSISAGNTDGWISCYFSGTGDTQGEWYYQPQTVRQTTNDLQLNICTVIYASASDTCYIDVGCTAGQTYSVLLTTSGNEPCFAAYLLG